MRRLAVLCAALVAALGTLAVGGTADAAAKYPVPYNFLPTAITGGAQSNAPGTNDWNCKPSKRHPRPVVLVHGTGGNKSTNWQTYGPLLANHGYCTFALTYGGAETANQLGGLGPMEDSARQLKRFVRRVLDATGAKKVDFVGHSQGTLMPDYYVKFLGGAKHVKRYVSLAPLWHGTQTSGAPSQIFAAFGLPADQSVPVCAACGQFAPDSAFLRKLRKGGVAVEGVDYTNIMTKYDELVTPYTSGREEGMRNIVVQSHCATDYTEHFEIAADPVAAGYVLNALDPAHPRTVPCKVVLPFVGGQPPA